MNGCWSLTMNADVDDANGDYLLVDVRSFLFCSVVVGQHQGSHLGCGALEQGIQSNGKGNHGECEGEEQ